MSTFVNVFCVKGDALSVPEIEELVQDAWLGEEDPVINVVTEHGDGGGWATLEVWLPELERPVVLYRDTGEEDIADFVAEVSEMAPAEALVALRARLDRTRQVVGLELHPEFLDDDAWEFVAVLEGVVARRLEGLIVSDEGAYDENLELLVNFRS